MTIRLLAAYDIYPQNAIVTLAAGTESGLIASGQATATTTGGVAYVAPAVPPVINNARVSRLGGVSTIIDDAGNVVSSGGTTAVATATTLGLVKVGSTLVQSASGALNVGQSGTKTLRQVASRCGYPFAVSTTQGFGHTKHKIFGSHSKLRVGFANYYSQSELSPTGGVQSYKTSIEYPIGSGKLTPFLYSGALIGTCASGADILSDELTLPYTIPDGASFWLWHYQHGSNGLTVSCGGAQRYKNDNSNDSLIAVGTTTFGLLDYMESDEITRNSQVNSGGIVAYYSLRPMVILGMSNIEAVGILGDSRTNPNGGDFASDDDLLCGMSERLVGKVYPFINLGSSGEKAKVIVDGTQGVKRRAYLQYCQIILNAYGTNDFPTSTTPGVVAYDVAMAALPEIAGKPLWSVTIPPFTNSTDFVATLANQAQGLEASRDGLNQYRRSQVGLMYEKVFEWEHFFLDTSTGLSRWRVNANGRTMTVNTVAGSTVGTHNIVTAATGTFTINDDGKRIVIPGAAAAAGQLTAKMGYISATQVRLYDYSFPMNIDIFAGTTTTGVNAYVSCGRLTADGIHETRDGNILGQAALQMQSRIVR